MNCLISLNDRSWHMHLNDSNLTFEQFQSSIQSHTNEICTSMKYIDEDGDIVNLSNDEDFLAMLETHKALSTSDPLHILLSDTPSNLGVQFGSSSSLASSSSQFDPADTDNYPIPTSPLHVDISASSSASTSSLSDLLPSTGMVPSDVKHLELIGRGNCGSVYKSLHISRDTVIAAKCISLDVDSGIQERILGELDIMHKCRSAWIVEFCGAYFLDNQISICMEFMDAGSLDIYGKLPPVILDNVSASVIRGLEYLWSLRIMHRDLKPSNMLLNSKGEIKLCDFGVSVQLANSIAKSYVGTNAYMSPERILGEDYRLHSEVWSLGISLMEMALGRFPYESDSASKQPVELLQAIVAEEPPKLTSEFDARLVDFVSACLVKESDKRISPEAITTHAYVEYAIERSSMSTVAEWLKMKTG